MKNLDAQYYYRPIAYTRLREEENVEETSIAEYIAQLNPDHHYWLITPHITCPIKVLSENIELENGNIVFGQNEWMVTIEDRRFTYQLNEYNPIHFIYTDVYEDPYEAFNEPVPKEQIEAAVSGDDLELQVRAWNTMYANPKELAEIINRVLSRLTITEENEMMISACISHFYKEGILTEAMIEKYRTLIN
jgi:hypothetical protein